MGIVATVVVTMVDIAATVVISGSRRSTMFSGAPSCFASKVRSAGAAVMPTPATAGPDIPVTGTPATAADMLGRSSASAVTSGTLATCRACGWNRSTATTDDGY